MEIEEVPVHKIYRIHITLDVPQKTLVAKQETHDLEGGIRTAFAEIERQIEAHKASLRGEHWWKRVARRKELHDMKAGGPGTETEETGEFFSRVEPHIERLSNFARHIVVSAAS